jgi:hypothetical protein
MKKLVDEMEAVGKKLDPEKITSYLLAGLDVEYNSVVSAVAARVEPITPSELLSQMIAMNFALRSYKGVMAIKLLLQTPPCVAVVDKEAAVVAG